MLFLATAYDSNKSWLPKIFSNNTKPHTASLAKWLKRPLREWKIPGSNPTCARIFPGSSYTSDLKTGTPVATLPGPWHYTFIGSVLGVGLVGLVSVYCDWVRWKV